MVQRLIKSPALVAGQPRPTCAGIQGRYAGVQPSSSHAPKPMGGLLEPGGARSHRGPASSVDDGVHLDVLQDAAERHLAA
jgi:hypothetical protein